MERPKFPKSLNERHINKTTHKIGQDMRGIVPYNFNNCGFRADTDYIETEQNAGCFFGHAFTSAVGIEWHNSYALLTCKELSAKCYNFSQGCVAVDNFEIIRTAIDVANMETFKPKFYVIQFCDLIRRFTPKNKKLSFFLPASKILHLLFYDDAMNIFFPVRKIITFHSIPFYLQSKARTPIPFQLF